jgi:hypothetical protein
MLVCILHVGVAAITCAKLKLVTLVTLRFTDANFLFCSFADKYRWHVAFMRDIQNGGFTIALHKIYFVSVLFQ